MAVTFGFYNSVYHDRTYDAVQFSSIFDGVITDGVFKHVENELAVRPGTSMTVIVGSGRAWFNHTWTLNDDDLVLSVTPASSLYNRIDSVVIEMDKQARTNSIKVIRGIDSSTPVPPELKNDEFVQQYRLANITVPSGGTGVTITDLRGTNECPWVTSPVYTAGSDNYYTKEEADAKFGVFTFAAGTTELVAGTTALATNKIYFCYE